MNCSHIHNFTKVTLPVLPHGDASSKSNCFHGSTGSIFIHDLTRFIHFIHIHLFMFIHFIHDLTKFILVQFNCSRSKLATCTET